jgi:hypothetical protein
MEGDLCNRPKRNARPKGLDDNDGGGFRFRIILNPNQGSPSPPNSDLNPPSDSNIESLNYPNYPIQPNSETNSNGSIFDRFCGLFGFGGGPYERSLSGGTTMIDNSLLGSSSAPDFGYSCGEELGTPC